MENEKKKVSAGRIALRVLVVLLVIVLLAAGAGALVVNHYLSKINYVSPGDEIVMSAEEAEKYMATQETEEPEDPNTETISDEDVDWGENTTQIGGSKNIVNIMLLGRDARNSYSNGRTDVMILVTVNKSEKTLTMTSFLRDSYVQIPGYQNNRINTAYFFGGLELVDEMLDVNFGLHVDGYLVVDFESFSDIIDLLGGVDVALSGKEAEYLNNSVGYVVVGSGTQHLNGNLALTYARIRKIDSDTQRVDRQKKILESLIEKFRNADISTLLDLMDQVLPLMTTDMTQTEILGYAMELLPLLPELQVYKQTIPTPEDSKNVMIRGMAVKQLDMDAARAMLEQTLGTD